MRIKKVSQTTSTQAQVVDGYSTSTSDSYSCNYVNGMNTYSTNEIDTGYKWIDGKPVYRKVYILSAIAGNNSYTLNPAPLNVDLMWFDLSATFLLQGGTGHTRQGIDSGAVDPGYDFSARVVSKVSVNIYVGNSIANNSTIYATLLYTKTTD